MTRTQEQKIYAALKNLYPKECAESREIQYRGYRSWHVQSGLAERGGEWRPTPFSSDSLSLRPLVTLPVAGPVTVPVAGRQAEVPPSGLPHSDLASRARVRMGGGKN